MDQMIFDHHDLRRAFGTYLTGVTIVTTLNAEGTPCGMTANSFTSVSLDPPLVLVCIGRNSSNIDAFRQTKSFVVNVLGSEQEALAMLFAARGADRFAAAAHSTAQGGAPILSNCMSWFECTPHEQVLAGDHLILIGRVEAFSAGRSKPLGFHGGRFVRIPDEHDLLSRSARESSLSTAGAA